MLDQIERKAPPKRHHNAAYYRWWYRLFSFGGRIKGDPRRYARRTYGLQNALGVTGFLTCITALFTLAVLWRLGKVDPELGIEWALTLPVVFVCGLTFFLLISVVPGFRTPLEYRKPLFVSRFPPVAALSAVYFLLVRVVQLMISGPRVDHVKNFGYQNYTGIYLSDTFLIGAWIVCSFLTWTIYRIAYRFRSRRGRKQ